MIYKTTASCVLASGIVFTAAQLVFLEYTKDSSVVLWQLKLFLPAIIIFAAGHITLAFVSFWIFRSIRAEHDALGGWQRYTPRAWHAKTRRLLRKYYVVGAPLAALIGVSCSLATVWAVYCLSPDHLAGTNMLSPRKLTLNAVIGAALLIVALHEHRDYHAWWLARGS